jgi:hypothetical protein
MSTCCGRWLGETGKPGAAAQGGVAPARPFPGLGAQGVSGCEAASLGAAVQAEVCRGRGAVAGASAPVGEAASPVRLPAHPRPAPSRGLVVQPQTGAAAVAGRGAAPTTQGPPAPQRPADARPRGRGLSRPGVGARLPLRPNSRRPADQDPDHHRRAHPRGTRHPGSPPDHL